MRIEELDRKEYEDIPLYPLGDGQDNRLPFFAGRYSLSGNLSPLHRHSVIQINYVSRGSSSTGSTTAITSWFGGTFSSFRPMCPTS